MQARIADPTDTFRVSADWRNPDAVETLGYIEPPAFVAVTGRATLVGSGPGHTRRWRSRLSTW